MLGVSLRGGYRDIKDVWGTKCLLGPIGKHALATGQKLFPRTPFLGSLHDCGLEGRLSESLRATKGGHPYRDNYLEVVTDEDLRRNLS